MIEFEREPELAQRIRDGIGELRRGMDAAETRERKLRRTLQAVERHLRGETIRHSIVEYVSPSGEVRECTLGELIESTLEETA